MKSLSNRWRTLAISLATAMVLFSAAPQVLAQAAPAAGAGDEAKAAGGGAAAAGQQARGGEQGEPAKQNPDASKAPAHSAQQILEKVDDLYRGESSKATMTMRVVTEHWTRELKMQSWSKGEEKSLIRILSPAKERGTATLKSGNNIWNYLPKVNRVIKVPSSMMSSSWMGSHFTNDDLVKESRYSDDYSCKITDSSARLEGAAAIELSCEPKPDAPVVWGKVTVTVRQQDYIPLRVRYFDEDMELARTMVFSDIEQQNGRTLPTTMRMQPADEPGESTTVHYEEIDFGVDIDDDFFSLRNLKR